MKCNLKFLFNAATILYLLSLPLLAMNDGDDSSPKSNRVRFVSWNITADFFDPKGNPWAQRRQSVLATIKELNPDILALQELSPTQALELAELPDYRSLFLCQTPSDVEAGLIVENKDVGEWVGKNIGTPLVGILYEYREFELGAKGRFWLNENPDSLPTYTDRTITDKGFGNMNTYRAPLWAELKYLKTGEKFFVFSSHYPLSGNHETRLKCAKVEREEIEKKSQGKRWISLGDRNIIPQDDSSTDDMAAMQPLLDGAYDAVNPERHEGPKTTFAGFNYDTYKNPLVNGSFKSSKVLDVVVSNFPSLRSQHVITQFNSTGKIELNPDVIGDERNFASDHLVVVADYVF